MEAQRCRYLLEEPKILKEWRRSSERGAGNDALRRLFGRPYRILSLGLPGIDQMKIERFEFCKYRYYYM